MRGALKGRESLYLPNAKELEKGGKYLLKGRQSKKTGISGQKINVFSKRRSPSIPQRNIPVRFHGLCPFFLRYFFLRESVLAHFQFLNIYLLALFLELLREKYLQGLKERNFIGSDMSNPKYGKSEKRKTHDGS